MRARRPDTASRWSTRRTSFVTHAGARRGPARWSCNSRGSPPGVPRRRRRCLGPQRCLAGRDRDDGVRVAAAAGAASAGRRGRRARRWPARRRPTVGPRGVHEQSARCRPNWPAAARMMHATTRAAIASPSPTRGDDGSHAIEDGERAGPVAGEVKRVGAQRRGPVPACGTHRDSGPAHVEPQRNVMAVNTCDRASERVMAARELPDGLAGDEDDARARTARLDIRGRAKEGRS